MEEILKIIVEYISIWLPSLVSISGIVVTVVTALKRTRDAINEYKNDKTVKELADKLTTLANENKELVECNKLLLDNITKIKDYKDNINKK